MIIFFMTTIALYFLIGLLLFLRLWWCSRQRKKDYDLYILAVFGVIWPVYLAVHGMELI